MIVLSQYYSKGVISVYCVDGVLKGSLILPLEEEGVCPIELDENDLAMFEPYSNILEQLRNGNKLYINGIEGYIGTDHREGPYSEGKYFLAEYEATDPDFYGLLGVLEKEIKDQHCCRKKIYR